MSILARFRTGFGTLLLWCIVPYILSMSGMAALCLAEDANPQESRTITAVIPPDFPPTYYREPKTGAPRGLAVDVTNELARLAGLHIEYRFAAAWDEIEDLALTGKADIIPFRVINEKTESRFLFTLPLDTAPINFICRSSDNRPEGLLPGRTIGVIDGSTAHVWLKKSVPDADIVPYSSMEHLLMSLLTGKIDRALTVTNNFFGLADAAGLQQKFRAISPAVFEVKRAIAVRPGNEDLRNRLNDAIRVFEGSEEQKDILRSWLGQPEPWWTVQRVLLASGGFSFLFFIAVLLWRFRGIHLLAKRLRDEKAFLQTVIDAIPDPIFFKDGQGRFTGCNVFFAEMVVGLTRDRILGKNHLPVDAFQECCMTPSPEEPGKFDCPVTLQDGRLVLFEVLQIPFYFAKDQSAGVIGIARDITKRDQTHRIQAEARNKLQIFLDNIPMLAWLKDAEGRYEMVNEASSQLCGRALNDMLGKTVFDVYPLETAEEFSLEDRQVIKTGSRLEFEKAIRIDSGDKIYHTIKTPILDGEGAVSGTAGISWDVTEQRQAVEALQRFKILVDHSRDIILFVRYHDLRIMEANLAAQLAYGYSREQLLATSVPDLRAFSPDPALADQREEADKHGIIFETAHRRSDGSIFPVEVSSRGETIGEVRMLVSIVRDITERKRNEETLRRNETEYRRLFNEFQAVLEAIPDSLSLITPDFNVVWANTSAVKTMLTGGGHYQGIPCHTLWKMRESPCETCHLQEVLSTGKTSEFTVSAEGKTWEFRLIPVKDQNGEIINTIRLSRDITETKNLESQLWQSHKLEAIGTLAGGIAHDFNNVLSPIIGYAEMALEDLAGNPTLQNDLEQILAGAHRAKDLVRQIITFSRMGKNERLAPVEISSIVKEAVKFLRASLPASITISQNIEHGSILGDATQIHQIVVNLCTNAAHAMDGVGSLDVALMNVVLKQEEMAGIPALWNLAAGRHLRLTVADTGHGMDSETLQRIFDPFFTTKGPEKGTGLGLAVVHGIVQKHKGAIVVESAPGKGSTFRVYFPTLEKSSKSAPAEKEVQVRGSERILVIDDERLVAKTMSSLLERLGYTVQIETSPDGGLNMFRSSPEDFDLVITDYTMPKKNGLDLAGEMMEIRPDLPIILYTGFSDKLSKEAVQEKGIRAVLMKPVDSKTLGRTVREILNGTV
jgi:PAS domain S-box-containing protein